MSDAFDMLAFGVLCGGLGWGIRYLQEWLQREKRLHRERLADFDTWQARRSAERTRMWIN